MTTNFEVILQCRCSYNDEIVSTQVVRTIEQAVNIATALLEQDKIIMSKVSDWKFYYNIEIRRKEEI